MALLEQLRALPSGLPVDVLRSVALLLVANGFTELRELSGARVEDIQGMWDWSPDARAQLRLILAVAERAVQGKRICAVRSMPVLACRQET